MDSAVCAKPYLRWDLGGLAQIHLGPILQHLPLPLYHGPMQQVMRWQTKLFHSAEELALRVKAVVQGLGLSGEDAQNVVQIADGKDSFPIAMVGGVLQANKRWDIGKEVVNCISKDYPDALPIRPKASSSPHALSSLLLC